MLMSLLQSFKKHTIASALIGSVVLLTACGGGGGGGGGGAALPQNAVVEFPDKNSAINDGSADFRVSFANSSVDTSTLLITLNGADVTSLFSGTGTSDRTASVYALSGMLEDGTNYFNAKVDGSSVSGVEFTYDAKPEVILTTLTGAGPYTANGVTRQAPLSTVVLNTISGDVVSTPAPTAHTFARTFNTMPDLGVYGLDVLDEEHFSVVATDTDSDAQTSNLVVPASRLKYGAAIQFNNSLLDQDSVIAGWIGTVLQQELGAVFTGFEAKPTYSPAYDDTGLAPLLGIGDTGTCQLIDFVSATVSLGATNCKLFVSNIEYAGTPVPEVAVLNSGINDDTFQLQVKVTFPALNVTLDNPAFDPAYIGGLVTTFTYSNVVFAFKVDVTKLDGKIVALSPVLPASPYLLTLGNSAVVTARTCDICDGKTPTELNELLTIPAGDAIPTLEDAILTELATTLTPRLETDDPAKLDLHDAYVANRAIYKFVTDANDVPVSALNFALSGSVVNEAKTTAATAPAGCDATSKVCGGFIGIGGSTYADDTSANYPGSPVLQPLIPAIGSYFVPVVSTSKVAKNFFNATDDVAIALSGNSLNQLLLSMYQSGLLAARDATLSFGDLGLANPGIPFRPLAADDLVTIHVEQKAIPSSSFATGGDMELRLNALAVTVTLYWDCTDALPVGMTVDECTKLYTSEFELDAKMLMNIGLDAVSQLPKASVLDTSIHIVNGMITNTFEDPITTAEAGTSAAATLYNSEIEAEVDDQLNAGNVAVLMTAVLTDYVADQTLALQTPYQCNIDLPGYALDDAWLVLQTLTTEEDFVRLSATIVPDAVTPPKGIVKLKIFDSTDLLDPDNALVEGCDPLVF